MNEDASSTVDAMRVGGQSWSGRRWDGCKCEFRKGELTSKLIRKRSNWRAQAEGEENSSVRGVNKPLDRLAVHVHSPARLLYKSPGGQSAASKKKFKRLFKTICSIINNII